jgi:acetyl esterase/lipase
VTLHPQSVAALELWAQGPSVADPGFGPADVAAKRAEALAAAAVEPLEQVDRVEDVDADGVPCRLYVPDGAQRTIVFLHGGGFVFGEVATHDGQARRLANRTGSAVLAVDYRRPPEHPFPAAPDDVFDEDLSPYFSEEMGTLPPTLVQVAEHDVLADEDHELVRRMRAADVMVEETTYAGMIHGFWRNPQLFDAAEDALVEIAGFLDRHV